MNLKFSIFLFFFLFSVSCGEYDKILKSSNIPLKCEIAKKYFNSGRYSQSILILKDAIPLIRGTEYIEESLYLLAKSYYYEQKNFVLAAEGFASYCDLFPRGKYTESACFYSAYSFYLSSPDAQFDQLNTYKAILGFQKFLKKYPQSNKKKLAQCFLYELKEKLAFKELIAVCLYYKLKNYLSCVITAQNALQFYSFSKYREHFMFFTFKSKCKIILQCMKNLKADYCKDDIIDEYYSYIREYSSGEKMKEVKKLFNNIIKRLDYYDSKKKIKCLIIQLHKT